MTRTMKHRGRGRSPQRRAGTTSSRNQPRQVNRGQTVRRGVQSGRRFSTPLIAAACLAIVAILGGIGYVAGAFRGSSDVVEVVRHIVYTARTGNVSAFAFPTDVKSDLESVGMAHGKVAVTRIDGDGQSTTNVIDLTPRAGDSPSDPILTVETRALPKIEQNIAGIQDMINSPATLGDQALYTGLTRTNFTSIPTIIVSTGIDLADPTDFRKLAWTVTPETLVETVKQAGTQAALHGPVTFVTVPTGGDQPQLGQAEKSYRNIMWKALLTSAGATSVTFIDGEKGTPTTNAPLAPPVAALSMPGTPIIPVTQPNDPTTVTCTVPGSYFTVNTPKLRNEVQTVKDLTECVTMAVKAGAKFSIDGWTSYEGPLTADGKPANDEPAGRELSQQRIDAIVTLLIEKFGVTPESITTKVAHGNTDQPFPADPSSELNRTVRITYLAPTAPPMK